MSQPLDRAFALEAVRVTEAAARAAADHIGRGDEHAADQAAVEAMRAAFNILPIDGTVVIGEGERDEAPMLYIGEKVGIGRHRCRYRARSARRHHADRQGAAQCAGRHGDGRARHAAERARHLYGQDRHRRRLSRRHDRSRCRSGREHPVAGQGQGREAGRHHRLHPRPAAPRVHRREDRARPARRCT